MPFGIRGSAAQGGKPSVRSAKYGEVVLVGLCLAVATAIESLLQPSSELVATPFAIPIMVAACFFGRRGVILTASVTEVIVFFSAYVGRVPLIFSALHLLSLLIIAGLGVLLVQQRQEIVRNFQESQQAMRIVPAVIEAVPSGVVISNEHGKIIFANSEARALLGGIFGEMDDRALIGRDGPSQWDQGVPQAFDFPLAQVLASGESKRDVEIHLAQPGQSERTILAAGRPIPGDSGQVTGAVVTFQEITARKQAEEEWEQLLREVEIERARLQTIFEHTASGIVYIDAETLNMVCNPAALRLFNLPTSPSGYRYPNLGQLLTMDGVPVAFEDMPSQRALHGETIVDAEYLFLRVDGTRVPVRESAAAVRDALGRIVGAELTFQDVSAFRELERLREEWMSVVAHDLRQPVTLILGFASLLSKQLGAYPTLVAENRATDQVLAAVRNLNKMVGDLLDFSRIEARRLRLDRQPADLTELIGSLRERLAAIAADHPMRFDIQSDGALTSLVDSTRFEQILGNLVSNAAKYGYPSSEIVVEVRKRGDDAEVAVTNQGPGIEPQDLPRLFSRFYRTREAETGHAGLGLGLYITRGLVEAHGGKISVDSVPGEVTKFRFSLPLLTEDLSQLQ